MGLDAFHLIRGLSKNGSFAQGPVANHRVPLAVRTQTKALTWSSAGMTDSRPASITCLPRSLLWCSGPMLGHTWSHDRL